MDKKHLKRKLFTLAPTGRECGCFNQFGYNHERGGCIGEKHQNNLTRKDLSVLVPQYPSNLICKKLAFTLAEVLITLGIIGVVAALTLPNIINNYKRKQLEIGFKHSSSIIQQALKQTANDFGYDNFSDINSVCSVQSEFSNCKSANQALFNSINADFISKFKVVKKAGGINAANFEGKVIPTYNYIGKQGLYYSQLYGMNGGGYFLSDGTYVTGLAFYYHGWSDGGVTLTFDTNGPYKGPNRLGYDIFIYATGGWTLLCSKEKSLAGVGPSTLYNGRGCYQYAQKDVNPDDKTKGYWESLYK